MQPTYLPYLGYFHLVARADTFVFLDDVQFARRSWQQRNRVLGGAGEVMLTVPVRKASRDAPICEIEICDDEPWREKHFASIRHAYGSRPFYEEGATFIGAELGQPYRKLADLNCGLIEAAAKRLRLKSRFERASNLKTSGQRSEHLLSVCKAVGANEYVSPMGSQLYMEEDGVFLAAGYPVSFQAFVPIAYPQGRESFTPYMTFLDAVMNLGWDGTARLIASMSSADPVAATS